MNNRTVLVAVLAAILAAPAGRASTPCDALPTTNKVVVTPEKIGDALCNACVGVPVPGKRDPLGNGLDYNDGAKHWECEMMVGNRGNGQCKRQTTCLPGGDRFDDHGVFRCRYPAVVATAPNTPANPRDACERALRISISRVKDWDGIALPNNVVHKGGSNRFLVEGEGVANGVSATFAGGAGVSVGDAARRVGPTLYATCLPPNCQVVSLDDLANTATGRQTLTLFTPHQFASASVDLYVDVAQGPPSVGDAECNSAAQQSHVRLQLASTRVSPGTTTNGQVFLTFSAPTPNWTLTLHQSLLQSVSPAIVKSPPANPTTPVAFTFSVAPAPPPQRPPVPGAPVPFGIRTGGRACVWARLESSLGTETVAVPVDVTP